MRDFYIRKHSSRGNFQRLVGYSSKEKGKGVLLYVDSFNRVQILYVLEQKYEAEKDSMPRRCKLWILDGD